MAFVYKIVHVATGRCYVGHTSRFPAVSRFKGHVHDLKKDQHANTRLQNSWNRYGASAFEFVILERCSESLKLDREQHYIDTLDPFYNIARVAGSRLGVPQPPHVGEAVRQANLNREHPKPANFSRTMRRVMKGKLQRGVGWSHSEETVEKIRASNKANTTRAYVGMTGKKHKKKSKKLMALAKIGKKQSPEHVAKRFAWQARRLAA